jgi:hypothetical protein
LRQAQGVPFIEAGRVGVAIIGDSPEVARRVKVIVKLAFGHVGHGYSVRIMANQHNRTMSNRIMAVMMKVVIVITYQASA